MTVMGNRAGALMRDPGGRYWIRIDLDPDEAENVAHRLGDDGAATDLLALVARAREDDDE